MTEIMTAEEIQEIIFVRNKGLYIALAQSHLACLGELERAEKEVKKLKDDLSFVGGKCNQTGYCFHRDETKTIIEH